jgi:hypothetical protein
LGRRRKSGIDQLRQERSEERDRLWIGQSDQKPAEELYVVAGGNRRCRTAARWSSATGPRCAVSCWNGRQGSKSWGGSVLDWTTSIFRRVRHVVSPSNPRPAPTTLPWPSTPPSLRNQPERIALGQTRHLAAFVPLREQLVHHWWGQVRSVPQVGRKSRELRSAALKILAGACEHGSSCNLLRHLPHPPLR